MFDTVLVAKELIDKIEKAPDVVFQSSEGYYDFQTKDLDNALSSFYIEADGTFYYYHQDFEWKQPDPKAKWPLPYMSPIGEPEKRVDARVTYLEFYDFIESPTERIFVTFLAHIKNGKLAEPIVVKSISRDNLEEEAIRTKKYREDWEKVQATWQWKLATKISWFCHKIRRLLYPIENSISELESYLRKEAKKVNKISEK